MYDVILRPLLTEKGNDLENIGKYLFSVNVNSNKSQIKKAFEKIFDVEVKSVNIINICGKIKIFKGTKGKRPNIKKAIVTTKDMKKIEISKGV